jgi:hypothetical protein
VLLELRSTAPLAQRPRSHSVADLLEGPRGTSDVATITISRQSADDVPFREIFVSVDGEQIAILSHGDVVSHDLPAGPHRVRAHNTLFWKTHDIVLRPGEHARFVAINRAGWGSFGWLMILGAAPLYLTFERERSD